MGSKPILLPFDKSEIFYESNDWTGLKNRFSGEALFKINLYNLLVGDLSVLENTENNWFFKALIQYTERTLDINFLPVLKKISSGNRFGESLRQKSTELMELIEARYANGKNSTSADSVNSEYTRAENARKILAGVRFPQTTEILRLIRDKSPELRRLALCLIGKFRVADMTHEVCECLNVPGLESDALSVLSATGKDTVKEINRFYLTSSGNINTSKSILRLYSQLCPSGEMSFLLDRLLTNSRPVKEISLNSLLKCGYIPDDEERVHLRKQICTTFDLMAWLISARISLYDNNDKILLHLMEKEYKRWNLFLRCLLYLTFGESITPALKEEKRPDDLGQKITGLVEIIYSNSKPGPKEIPDIESDRKKLRKMQQYFSCLIPQYQTLLEDIINCDYNMVSVWMKASAIRNIRIADNEHIKETVVAVLFSPEWILKEEAAKLISSSDMDLFLKVTERLPVQDRVRINKITKKESDENELLYEKVLFLSSCLPSINEDELIWLAERTEFIRRTDPDLNLKLENSVAWALTPSKKILKAAVIYDKKNANDFLDNIEIPGTYLYVVKLDAVELFRFYYPDSSFSIFKYVDGLED